MRRLATAAFAFAAGIFLAQYWLPGGWMLPGAAACLAAGTLGFAGRGIVRLRIFLLAAGLAAGLAYHWAYMAVVQSPAELLAGTERQLPMTVCAYPSAARYGAKVTVRLRVEGLHGVKAVYYGDESLLTLVPGDRITGDAALKSAAKIRDTEVTTFTSKGIFLLAYRRGPLQVEPGGGDLRELPLRVGHAAQAQIAELFDGDAAGFLTAILTGDKSGLSDQAATDLSEAGLYHILAVSGMHCAFLLAMVEFLTGRQRRKLTAAAAIPILLFYMLLTGCSPSVVRACVMLIFLLSAPLAGRERDASTAMAAALAVILLQNPFAAASISLQLSFAAVAGLLWVTPKLTGAFTKGKKRGRAARFAVFSVSATLGATVFTAPLSAYYFNIFWLITPLSSLLCLWAAGAVFCLGFLAVGVSFVWLPLGQTVGFPVRLLVRYILWMSGALAGVPGHAVYFSNPYLKYWLAFAYLLFALAWALRSGGRRKYALAGILACLTLWACVRAGAAPGRFNAMDIRVLNVGQGACTVVSSRGEYALIDCGSNNSWYDAGEIAADELRSLGCSRLRALMLTHYDYDHVSGVTDLMSRLRVDELLLPDTPDGGGLRELLEKSAGEHGVPIRYVAQETELELGSAAVTIYPPLGKSGDNERGLAYLCSFGDYDLLITGDMDLETEKELIGTYDLPDIEVLAVGHHGSKFSASAELLEALKPELGIISVGSNSYGHPARQTLRRLAAAGVQIYRTDLQGAIHIAVN